jgi:hypothetical protein
VPARRSDDRSPDRHAHRASRVGTSHTVGDVERARCELAMPPTELRIFRWESGHVASFQRAE